MNILLFSRGFGYGHAKRDLYVADCLRKRGCRVIIASYADGYAFLHSRGEDVLNLGLQSRGDDARRIAQITRCVLDSAPDVIIADEELISLAIGHAIGVPSIFLTNWTAGDPEIVKYLEMAQSIFVFDIAAGWIFPQPVELQDRTFFVGPAVDMCSAAAERHPRILITAGGAPMIEDARFFLAAIKAAAHFSDYHKLVVCGRLRASLKERGDSTFEFVDVLPDLTDRMAECGLVICRGGHTTLWELAASGTPTIAIPRPESINPYNIIYAQQMQARGFAELVPEDDMTSDVLVQAIKGMLHRHLDPWTRSGPPAVEVIADRVQSI